MIVRFHTVLVLGHILALALGLGAALLADWVVLRKLVSGIVSQKAAGQLIDLSHAVCAGLVLIWVTGALLVAGNALDAPASIMNQKLWAKLAIVTVLTLNALLLHGIVLPRVTSRVGKPLFERMLDWFPMVSILLGAVSATSWTFAAFLGVARELNGDANLTPILASYLVALLLSWVAAVMLSCLVRHCGTRLKFRNGNHHVMADMSVSMRWSRPVGQFSGRVKLSPGCRQAASFSNTRTS